MMRRAAARHHQPHRIAFITKRRLHADKDIAKLNTLNQQLASKRIDASRRRSPIVFDFLT